MTFIYSSRLSLTKILSHIHVIPDGVLAGAVVCITNGTLSSDPSLGNTIVSTRLDEGKVAKT